jgi:hypothetical protein
MDFYKTKQPIALPLDSEDEKLLKDNREFDPELATNPPPQQESGKRCCFKKGTKGRKAIRRVGHLLILGAFFYWLWRPSAKSHHGGHDLHDDMQFSDVTDLDEIPGVVPEDFLWVRFRSFRKP